MQSKMSVVAQAGAAGLILGQRGIDHLTCQPFGESAEKPKVIWQGSYYGGPEKIQKSSDDFRHDFMLSVGEDERVTMGCAVNTVVIASLDMQELMWSLAERKAALADSSDRMIEYDPAQIQIVAEQCRRKINLVADPIASHCASQVQKFALIKGREETAFRHVFDNQRHILSLVSPKCQSQFSFLEGIRLWVMKHPITKWRPYYHLCHLGLTFLVLQIVLELALMLYRSISLNGQGRYAALVTSLL